MKSATIADAMAGLSALIAGLEAHDRAFFDTKVPLYLLSGDTAKADRAERIPGCRRNTACRQNGDR